MVPSQPNCFLLSDVLKVYFQYAIPAMIEEGNNLEVEECKLWELVISLQQAGSDDETIYDELVKCNYSYGCPLALYQEFYEASYCYIEDIAKASKKQLTKRWKKPQQGRTQSFLTSKMHRAWAGSTGISDTDVTNNN